MVRSAAALQAALERKPNAAEALGSRNSVAAAALGSYKAPSREGKIPVTAYLSPDFKRSLRLIQAKDGGSLQDLIAEALNDLFAKHDVPTVTE